ncbi:helix-turn-helix domain-containing protein [Indioceanicola profundi]|uniref:helix-turn-helix domain-containing protein n=1 Tax=Indioceanicola profundi TaxID=2220096 RepID=UPI0013C441EE|nr:helix-turn-helix transcriptional regulator [Indioceanicola profundi]
MTTMRSASPAIRPTNGFGTLLRRWRLSRGTSQLDLALTCDTSQRHISFLESGRARPSRGMVLNLAGALAVPLRHQDAMLLAAGFAPAYGTRPPEAPEMRPIQAVLDRMLERQEPFPAVVVDRHYNLVQANEGAMRLLGFLLGPEAASAPPINLVQALFSPPVEGLVENFREVALWTVRRLRAEALLEDPLAEDPEPLRSLMTHPALAGAGSAGAVDEAAIPALTIRFVQDGVRLSLLSVIASLGTPLDAGLQDLRVELFFPADEATEGWFLAG